MFADYFLYHNFLSEDDCDQIINESKNSAEQAKVQSNEGMDGFIETSTHRNSKIKFYYKDNKITNYIKQEIRQIAIDIYKFPIGEIQPLQYTLYDKDMFYNWHLDSTGDFDKPEWDRDLSATILLNNPDEYVGGELQFKTPINDTTIQLNKGSIVVFPSLTIHRVTKVKTGIRHSLVAWGTRCL